MLEELSQYTDSRTFDSMAKKVTSNNMEWSDSDEVITLQQAPQRQYSQHKVRTTQDSTLSLLVSQKQSQPTEHIPGVLLQEIPESHCQLTSVCNLREQILHSKHEKLSEIIGNHKFIGVVDLNRGISLIQHETKLYLVQHLILVEELFYQAALRQFGDFNLIKLDPQPSVADLVTMAINAESCLSEETKAIQTKKIVQLILSKQALLEEYFGIIINKDGQLECFPSLLPGYVPDLLSLPLFLLQLAVQVNWTNEEQCIQTIFQELACLYTSRCDQSSSSKLEHSQLQNIVFPYAKRFLVPSSSLLDQGIIEVANLPALYRIFERC